MRWRAILLAGLLLAPAACRRRAEAPVGPRAPGPGVRAGGGEATGNGNGNEGDDDESGAPRAAPPPVPRAALPNVDPMPEAPDVAPERRAIQVVAGQERVVDADAARAKGLTIVDLSDGWAPAIFDDATAPDGKIMPNRYRAIFVGLANDKIDGDGQPLLPGERNYLELFGVPPVLSVMRERVLADAARTCDRDTDVAKLKAVDEVHTWGTTTEKQELSKHRLRGLRLEQARVKAGVETLEALGEADARYAKEVKQHRRFEAERAAFAEVEKRLACEGLYEPKKHKAGSYDAPLRKAVLDFQHKHGVVEQSDIQRGTLEALTHPLLDNDFAALRRVLTERAVHAAGVVEDGTAPLQGRGKKRGPATYLGNDGQRHPVPDLAAQTTDALMARLGLGAPEDAVAFFKRHPAKDFVALRAAVRFPPLPDYYGPQMDLFGEIDRGDIWYDFPFNDKGVRLPQGRNKYPSFTLYVRWKDERVPLVRWRTTIGGWRSELAADGEEYYRYKDSDVGPRVWRHIVASPVWIPPRSSPLGSMVKEKLVNGSFVRVTNYDETGPGYLSAYGLVAGIHEKVSRRNGDVHYHDNGIRTHGSFDYMSLKGRFSHGCHRLHNNLAVRVFTFVLKHRRHKVLGPMALGFRQTFWWKGDVYDMRLPTRGFYYELDPTVSVETLEGNIKGKVQAPITDYVRKPGTTYTSDRPPPAPNSPEAKAGGAGG